MRRHVLGFSLTMLGVVLVVVSTTATPPPVWSAVLSVDPEVHGVPYRYDHTSNVVTATSPIAEPSTTVREVFWLPQSEPSTDQQVCTTLLDTARSGGRPYAQPGVALRIAPSGDPGTSPTAISVEQNTFGSATWRFWIHTWQPRDSPRHKFTKGFSFRPIIRPGGLIQPPPWNLCARVQGTRIDVKLWLAREAEPRWGEPDSTFSTRLPTEWVYPGFAGGYVGHLAPGRSVRFANLDADRLGSDG